ncbi:aromatic acid exporter family protein [Catenulispora yoronensis]
MPRATDSVGEFTRELLGRGHTTLRAGFERSVRALRLHGVRHWFRRERDAFRQTLKTALACAVAWELAKYLIYHGDPQVHAVLAPVAVLITMQVTIYQTFRRGLQQVAAVVLGVIAALALGAYIELTWYTLSALVIIALIIGRTLRLGTQVNQVATTSLLVYSLGRGYGLERVWDTLLGAGVGIIANAAVAPPTYSSAAAKDLADLADDLAELCREVAKALGSTWDAADARRWLDRSRSLFGDSQDTEEVADQAEEAVRYHPRRSALEAEVNRVDQAAICLSHVAAQLNGLLRGLYDLANGNAACRGHRRPGGPGHTPARRRPRPEPLRPPPDPGPGQPPGPGGTQGHHHRRRRPSALGDRGHAPDRGPRGRALVRARRPARRRPPDALRTGPGGRAAHAGDSADSACVGGEFFDVAAGLLSCRAVGLLRWPAADTDVGRLPYKESAPQSSHLYSRHICALPHYFSFVPTDRRSVQASTTRAAMAVSAALP